VLLDPNQLLHDSTQQRVTMSLYPMLNLLSEKQSLHEQPPPRPLQRRCPQLLLGGIPQNITSADAQAI
jgi:hypothetical protein